MTMDPGRSGLFSTWIMGDALVDGTVACNNHLIGPDVDLLVSLHSNLPSIHPPRLHFPTRYFTNLHVGAVDFVSIPQCTSEHEH